METIDVLRWVFLPSTTHPEWFSRLVAVRNSPHWTCHYRVLASCLDAIADSFRQLRYGGKSYLHSIILLVLKVCLCSCLLSRFFRLSMKLTSTARIDHILGGGALPHSTQVFSTLIELVDCRCTGPCSISCCVFCWALAGDWEKGSKTILPVQCSDVEHQSSAWRMSWVDDYGVRIFRIAVLRLLRNCQRPFPFPANLCSCCSWLHA